MLCNPARAHHPGNLSGGNERHAPHAPERQTGRQTDKYVLLLRGHTIAVYLIEGGQAGLFHRLGLHDKDACLPICGSKLWYPVAVRFDERLISLAGAGPLASDGRWVPAWTLHGFAIF